MKKFSIIAAVAAILAFSATSCEDYLDVNENVDAPSYVDAYLYLSSIIQYTGDIYWDIRGIGPLTQMMGTSSYTTYAQNYYTAGSDACGEWWRVTYWYQGMNLENVINQSIEEEDWTLAGIGLAIKAHAWDRLTKQHGEAPMSQAYQSGLLSHDYDYQEDIMAQARAWAYEAIEYLEMEDDHDYGTTISGNDWIYYGDKEKWKKFAYAVIVEDLAAMSNKDDFLSTYANELLECAAKSFESNDDNAYIEVEGSGSSAAYSMYNNFWGTYRANLSRSYFQHEYAVQVMTGTVPKYDESTGEKTAIDSEREDYDAYYPYELADEQIICDTILTEAGHYDPRVAVKLATTDDPYYEYIDNADSVKAHKYYGGSFTSTSGPIGTAPSFYGRNATGSTVYDGQGRWLFHDAAPYVLMTYAEIQFLVAETYYKMGNTSAALEAFKKAVAADVEMCAEFITPGTSGSQAGGDKIAKSVYNSLAEEYIAGPYCNGMTADKLTLSHIMMQRWVALFPWGAPEAWVDMRKYMYDISYSGDYPYNGNGWTNTTLDQKWDSDDSKVYKGLYLAPAQVTSRKTSYNTNNEGSPCFRLRPRYNSEYMWNSASLEALKPISGTAANYQCSIPWFAYPGDYPESL